MMSMGQDFALQYSAAKPEHNRAEKRKDFVILRNILTAVPVITVSMRGEKDSIITIKSKWRAN